MGGDRSGPGVCGPSPARRMKANRQHRVPLCGRALEILEAARTLGKAAGPLVFTHGQGKPLDDKQLRWLVREQGIAAVPHGFRSSFRDWGGEETDHPREVIEAAPAHVSGTGWRRAYARSGPVRASACPDGRLGALPGPRVGKREGRNGRSPVRHDLDRWLGEYLAAAGIGDAPKETPLFHSALGKQKQLSDRPLSANSMGLMLKRRLKDAGLPPIFSPHRLPCPGGHRPALPGRAP